MSCAVSSGSSWWLRSWIIDIDHPAQVDMGGTLQAWETQKVLCPLVIYSAVFVYCTSGLRKAKLLIGMPARVTKRICICMSITVSYRRLICGFYIASVAIPMVSSCPITAYSVYSCFRLHSNIFVATAVLSSILVR